MDDLTPPGHSGPPTRGGLLIGRARRFSTGCVVTAPKTNRFLANFHMENSTLARGTQAPGMMSFSPD